VQNVSYIAIQLDICNLKKQYLWWTSNWSYLNNIQMYISWVFQQIDYNFDEYNYCWFRFGLIDIFFSLFHIVFICHNFFMSFNLFMSSIKQHGMLCVAQFWLCHLKFNLWNGFSRNLGGNKLTGSFPSNIFNCSFMLQEVWVYVFTPNSMYSCSCVMGWTSIYLMVLGSFLA